MQFAPVRYFGMPMLARLVKIFMLRGHSISAALQASLYRRSAVLGVRREVETAGNFPSLDAGVLSGSER